MSSKICLAFVSATLLAAPFLYPALFPLAWIAFVPLFWAIDQAADIKRAVLFAWVTGFLAHLIGFHWLVYTISVFGAFSYAISGVVFLVYAALQGLQMAIFGLLARGLGFGPLGVYPALIWVALEFWFPLLFPWYLASTQSAFTTFIQTADIAGPYGASFIVMWGNAAFYQAFRSGKPTRARWRATVAVGILLGASVLYGSQQLRGVAAAIASAPKLTVAAVQGNIDVDLKWNPSRIRKNLEVHRSLSRQADGVPLVIWPESALEEWVPEGLTQLPADVMPAIDPNSYFIFGAKSFNGKFSGPDFKAFNTAFFTDADGRILDRYHKQVLLAFGEYIPFSAILAKLPAMPFADGFTAGSGPRAFRMSGGVRIAPLVCYEDLMPEVTRRFVVETGANLLVNLTNDAWYGRTVAPWQHARLAQWRAIETRRSLLRVTNTGVTAVINAKGQIERILPIFTPAVLTTEVDILEGRTFYARFGDWFAWSMTLMVAGIVLSRFAIRRIRT